MVGVCWVVMGKHVDLLGVDMQDEYNVEVLNNILIFVIIISSI